jgi:hypothetical protein
MWNLHLRLRYLILLDRARVCDPESDRRCPPSRRKDIRARSGPT